MTTITTKFVNPAASGKKFGSVVDSNNTRYPVAAGLVGGFEKGKSYEVTLEEQIWDGKPVTLIIGLDSTVSAPQRAAQVAAKATESNGHLAEPELRFVSNVVGSAITAKTLISPDEIGVWAKAAARAVKEI